MHDPDLERHPPDDAVATGGKLSLAGDRPMLGFYPIVGRRPVDLALAYPDCCGLKPPADLSRKWRLSAQPRRWHAGWRRTENYPWADSHMRITRLRDLARLACLHDVDWVNAAICVCRCVGRWLLPDLTFFRLITRYERKSLPSGNRGRR